MEGRVFLFFHTWNSVHSNLLLPCSQATPCGVLFLWQPNPAARHNLFSITSTPGPLPGPPAFYHICHLPQSSSSGPLALPWFPPPFRTSNSAVRVCPKLESEAVSRCSVLDPPQGFPPLGAEVQAPYGNSPLPPVCLPLGLASWPPCCRPTCETCTRPRAFALAVSSAWNGLECGHCCLLPFPQVSAQM